MKERMKKLRALPPKTQLMVKLAAALLAFLLAAFVALVLRDALFLSHPVDALPTLVVYYNQEEQARLPADNIRLAHYEWRFIFWQRQWTHLDLEPYREITPVSVDPKSELTLVFGTKPQAIQVSVKAGESRFVDLGDTMLAPQTPGEYTYRIQASWGDGRNVMYYFKIQIPRW